MSQTSEKFAGSTLTEKDLKEIELFLSKKRQQVVETLYEKKSLSQGELAEAIDTSTASLANILLKFRNFKYKLLDSQGEGKRRYYFLTNLGKTYIENYCKDKKNIDNEKVIYGDSFRTMQIVEDSFVNLKKSYEDKWETMLDDALIACIKYHLTDDEEVEEVDGFLFNVGRALIDNYENYSVDILELVSSNSILLDRFEKFFEMFGIISPLLQRWNDGIEKLIIYDYIENLLTDNEDRLEENMLQFSEKERRGLVDMMNNIVDKVRNKQEIYRLCKRITAGDQDLSAYLTKEICRKQKNEREK